MTDSSITAVEHTLLLRSSASQLPSNRKRHQALLTVLKQSSTRHCVLRARVNGAAMFERKREKCFTMINTAVSRLSRTQVFFSPASCVPRKRGLILSDVSLFFLLCFVSKNNTQSAIGISYSNHRRKSTPGAFLGNKKKEGSPSLQEVLDILDLAYHDCTR